MITPYDRRREARGGAKGSVTHMKIGVSSYSYNSLYERGTYTYFDAIRHAKAAGFDSFEFAEFSPPEQKNGDSENLVLIDFAKRLREACAASGLEVVCYAVEADFINGQGADIAAEIERVKARVDVAAALGARLMRHDACWGVKNRAKYRTYRDVIKKIAPSIREVSEYAAALGIRTMCENHGYFMQDSARMVELAETVDHKNFGLLVDIGNFMCADESSLSALENVLPYAYHVHAKDFLWKSGVEACPDDSWFPTRSGSHLRGTILGHGAAPVAQCLRRIAKSGYDGAISLEFEGLEEPLVAVERGGAYLRANLREKLIASSRAELPINAASHAQPERTTAVGKAEANS